jgi:glycosyltransferase involved in cell wall biosynthesis
MVVQHRGRGLVARVLIEQVLLARRSREYDVLYLPGNLALFAAGVPQVVCQQNAWYYTNAVREFRRRACSSRMRARLVLESAAARASIRRAEHVIAVSDTLRDMIESDIGRSPKITTVRSAPPRLPEPAPPTERGPYVLCVAHDDPHKDFDGLAAAFSRNADLPPLLIVGRCTPERKRSLESQSAGRVRLLGEVRRLDQLARLYRDATCVVAHSFFESFGFSPAEALSAGTPVAASDIPAHREVCGEGPVYYPAGDRDALASAVRAASKRPPAELGATPTIERGWSENAQELLTVLAAVGARGRIRRRRRGA